MPDKDTEPRRMQLYLVFPLHDGNRWTIGYVSCATNELTRKRRTQRRDLASTEDLSIEEIASEQSFPFCKVGR